MAGRHSPSSPSLSLSPVVPPASRLPVPLPGRATPRRISARVYSSLPRTDPFRSRSSPLVPCGSRRSDSTLDCSTVRQRRLASSGRPARQEVADSLLYRRPAPQAQVSRASSLVQLQMASSALKSGLYPADSSIGGSAPSFPAVPLPPRLEAPARCLRSHSAAPRASLATVPRRLPTLRCYCSFLHIPISRRSIHPLHFASLQTHCRVVAGLLSVPWAVRVNQGKLSLVRTHFPGNSASVRKWASSAKNTLAPFRLIPSFRAACSAIKSSLRDSFALTKRFLERLRANPRRCR